MRLHIKRNLAGPAGPYACRYRYYWGRLPTRNTLPIRRAFFDERPHALLRLGGRGNIAEIRDCFGNPAPIVVGAQERGAREPHRRARLLRERAPHGARFRAQPLIWHDPADEPEGSRFLRAEAAALNRS